MDFCRHDVGEWLGSVRPEDRGALLRRVDRTAATVRALPCAEGAETGDEAALGVAVFVLYADHLGVDPARLCAMVHDAGVVGAAGVVPLCVERMLADAEQRRGAMGGAPRARPRGGTDNTTGGTYETGCATPGGVFEGAGVFSPT